MVRTAKIEIGDTEYVVAFTPGTLRCAEDNGYDSLQEMMEDKRFEIRNIMLVIQEMIAAGAHLEHKAGREGKTITMEELRYEMSVEQMNAAVEALAMLQGEKPAVEAKPPKN